MNLNDLYGMPSALFDISVHIPRLPKGMRMVRSNMYKDG